LYHYVAKRVQSQIPASLRTDNSVRLLLLLLLLTLPAAVPAQFNCTDNGNGTATITGYTGSGGAVKTKSLSVQPTPPAFSRWRRKPVLKPDKP
jgi:hypothetical protein